MPDSRSQPSQTSHEGTMFVGQHWREIEEMGIQIADLEEDRDQLVEERNLWRNAAFLAGEEVVRLWELGRGWNDWNDLDERPE